ncbi:transglycosylase SLT domain-containing protein [Pseudarthrobacter sp. NIBRBAC000502770]|uniref:transglycosylase SLT domain-containing protein n=1 Tax=Pseudarthrobacter sp. NIBRBAC000502770 TaxID=2590785 RepID=UPI00143E03EE
MALAFAEQELSFHQNVTSSAGAIGVTQIISSSVTWASEMVGRPVELRNTPTDRKMTVWPLRISRPPRPSVGA